MVKEKEKVTYEDVFYSCLKCEDNEDVFTENILCWINKYSAYPVKKEEMNAYRVDSSKAIQRGKSEDFGDVNLSIEQEIDKNVGEVLGFEKAVEKKPISEIGKELPFSKKYLSRIWISATIFLVIILVLSWEVRENVMAKEIEKNRRNSLQEMQREENKKTEETFVKYRVVDKGKLQQYLIGRNSILAEEPYFSAILQIAQEFDVNPIILFAITGQEQAFVPKDHEQAVKIANNPYNVNYSWKKYNTDIEDASKIVARTIKNLVQGKPEGMDPFQWINRKYAEDQEWWKGVRRIYDDIEESIK